MFYDHTHPLFFIVYLAILIPVLESPKQVTCCETKHPNKTSKPEAKIGMSSNVISQILFFQFLPSYSTYESLISFLKIPGTV